MTQPYKKTNYHHGHLRDGLIKTTLFMLEGQSASDISLRKIAAHLGVSQTAVYSHFSNKTDLLAAIADQGFLSCTDYILNTVKTIKDPRQRTEEFAIQYMNFAFEHRTLFQLMYSREIQDLENHPNLPFSAGKLYSLFTSCWSRFQPDQMHQAPYVWSMIHGQTTLMCDPKFKPALSGGKSPKDMARASIDIFTKN